MTPIPTRIPATGVRKPARNEAPAKIKTRPTAHVQRDKPSRPMKYDAPWTITIRPTVARNNRRPTPGRPPGNVENSLCSQLLLVCLRSLEAHRLRISASPSKRIPKSCNHRVTPSWYINPCNEARSRTPPCPERLDLRIHGPTKRESLRSCCMKPVLNIRRAEI